jgi:putative nucleotidyltransferase with HDIG domain
MPLLAERFARDLEGLNDLPAMPPAVAQLIAAVESPDVSLPEVGEIIRTDPALAAQILRVANSAAYAGRAPARTIREALLRLGLKEVRRLAVVLSLYNAAGKQVKVVDHDTFWKHSLAVASAAEIIARQVRVPGGAGLGPNDGETLFLAGLFHDLGLLALASYYPVEYASVRRSIEDSDLTFCAAEMELLMTDHGELGAQLAAHWRLPPPAVAVIRAHHRAELAPPELSVAVLALRAAESACRRAGIADLNEGHVVELDGGIPELGLAADAIDGIVEETRVEAARAAAMLSVMR